MADPLFLTLLILHIGFIVAWLGGALLFTAIVTPSVQKLQPATRVEFVVVTLPRFLRFIAASSIGAVVAGVALYGYVTQVAMFLAPSRPGLVFINAGAVLGLVAFILAIGIVIPAGRKLVSVMELAAKNPGSPPTDAPRLQKRMRIAASSATGVLFLTLVLMVVGAFL